MDTATPTIAITLWAHDHPHCPLPLTLSTAMCPMTLPTCTGIVINGVGLMSIRDISVYPFFVLLTHKLSTDVAVVYCWDDLVCH